MGLNPLTGYAIFLTAPDQGKMPKLNKDFRIDPFHFASPIFCFNMTAQ